MLRWRGSRWLGRILILAGAVMGSGCAMPDRMGQAAPGTIPGVALQLATDLADADAATERAVGRIGEFAWRNQREAAAIAYATGRRLSPARRGGGATAADGSAALAAGEVLGPAFDALALHGRRLAGLAGELPPGLPDADPASLRRETEQGLARYEAALRRPLPLTPAERDAGLAAVATLATPPAPGAEFTAYVNERQPAVEALAALLRAVIGANPRSGLRAELAAGREEAMRAQTALLEAVRRDPAAGVMGRYALFHSAMRAQEDLPTDAVLAEVVRVLEALPAAHASLASGDASLASQRVEAFSAAVDRLQEAEAELERAAAD